MTSNGDATFRCVETQLEIAIDAPRENVWQALTANISDWWPAHFYVGQEPRGIVLEDCVGGRIYEDWGDGGGSLWATVLVFDRGSTLEWAGDMSPDFAGPARSMTRFKLREEDGSTVVEFRDSAYGRLADMAVEGMPHGWSLLLDGCLKPYLEEGKHPDRPTSVVAASN